MTDFCSKRGACFFAFFFAMESMEPVQSLRGLKFNYFIAEVNQKCRTAYCNLSKTGFLSVARYDSIVTPAYLQNIALYLLLCHCGKLLSTF